jgi:hypothetical protein
MQYNQASKPDICKACNAEVKAVRRAELHRHQHETLVEREAGQKYEREAKRKAIGDALTDSSKTPILTKYSKTESAKSRRKCRLKLEDIRIAKEFGVDVSDFVGESL